jgi:plastocyanin
MRKRTVVVGSVLLLLGAGAGDGQTRHEIGQKNKTFSENQITVRVGDKVVFKNDDAVTHNVFSSTPGHQFNSKSQPPGTETAVSFDREGTVAVRCAIHPTMKLTVKVLK